MWVKKIVILTICLLCMSGIAVNASVVPLKFPETVFMGTVKEVAKENDGTIRILVNGYIKGCEVYPEELIVFIRKDTKILVNPCIKIENDETLGELNISVGDYVYLVLNEAMTKSIPPQVSAKKIQLTKYIKE